MSMRWQRLQDQDIKKFITDHVNDDVATLALKKPPSADWDYPLVLDQIKAKQKAKDKLPSWYKAEGGVILPRPDLIEQASSEACARYKASLIKGQSFADLTGGAGIDTVAFAAAYEEGECVEVDAEAASLIQHNLELMTIKPIKVIQARAEEYVPRMPRVDLAYIDPQRREGSKKGRFRFEDCSPDILALLPDLLKKADHIMVKASPMLDIKAGIEALGAVEAVHVVEWRGDCRELLFILGAGGGLEPQNVPITAVAIDDKGGVIHEMRFTGDEEAAADALYSMPLDYIYEPGAVYQKSGGFKVMCERYGVQKLHEHTHLYTSGALVKEFPGRAFAFKDTYPAQAKKMPVKKANLSVRNFPARVDILRKKLKITDGGEDYLFACTLYDGAHVLLHCQKI